jgi:methyl-accepting chemotaxis protein
MERKERKKIRNSIQTKIIIMVNMGMILLGVILLTASTVRFKSEMNNTLRNYILAEADMTGRVIDNAVSNGTSIDDKEAMTQLLKGINVNGTASSYAYLVSADATMMWHPTESKIGQPVENSVVKGLVADIQAGTLNKYSDIIEYEYKGAIKYAGYYIDEAQSFILVITADKNDLFMVINRTINVLIILSLIALIALDIFGMIYLVRAITRPLKVLTNVVDRVSDLDLTVDDYDSLLNRSDEIGLMSRAVSKMCDSLDNSMSVISKQAGILKTESAELSESATNMSETCEEVDRAVLEIADGASNQADETSKATDNVVTIGVMIEATNEAVNELSTAAESMSNAESNAQVTLRELNEISKKTTEVIDTIAEKTAKTNESAEKIQEVTALIAGIANQTNLLSLNASIEAARAGDAGRGFAVVAEEISKLADQSNESARQIDDIVKQLIADSDEAVASMDEVKNATAVQTEGIMKTGEAFDLISDGINTSNESIKRIVEKVKEIDNARVSVVDTVQNLTAIAEENAASTEESSASVSNIDTIAVNIQEDSVKLSEIAVTLGENVARFKLKDKE